MTTGSLCRLAVHTFAVVSLGLCLSACRSPGVRHEPPKLGPANVDVTVAHSLATLDAWCWRLELSKNTDYSVLASASGGGISDASAHAQGKSWAEALGQAVKDLEADMAAKGITPEQAAARQGAKTFSEAAIEAVRDRYQRIDSKAWYLKATKSSGWTIQCKADIGQVAPVSANGEGPDLLAALDNVLANLEAAIAKRLSNRK